MQFLACKLSQVRGCSPLWEGHLSFYAPSQSNLGNTKIRISTWGPGILLDHAAVLGTISRIKDSFAMIPLEPSQTVWRSARKGSSPLEELVRMKMQNRHSFSYWWLRKTSPKGCFFAYLWMLLPQMGCTFHLTGIKGFVDLWTMQEFVHHSNAALLEQGNKIC